MKTVKKGEQLERSGSLEGSAMILIWVGVVLVTLSFIFFYFGDILFKLDVQDFAEKNGFFGEYVGGVVGSIWSLAGIILFYDALKVQRIELRLQRHELELNRTEIIEQNQLSRAQNETLAIQTFENTFFQLLMLHNEIVHSIEIEIEDPARSVNNVPLIKKLHGREVFLEFYNIFKDVYGEHIEIDSLITPGMDDFLEIIQGSFGRFLYLYHASIAHYLRNLYNVINFIDKSEIKNKTFYTNLVHAHLSNYELMLIFYAGFSDEMSNFKLLIEKYGLLQNLKVEELLDRRHTGLYDKYAFTSIR